MTTVRVGILRNRLRRRFRYVGAEINALKVV